MSLCSEQRKGRFVAGLLIALAITLISSPALAQSDYNPKFDVFSGINICIRAARFLAPAGIPTIPPPTTYRT